VGISNEGVEEVSPHRFDN